MHEASLHKANCATLLTYDRENLPPGGGLVYEHVQRFHKRLRKALGAFRFYMCGEYGTKNLRPHYHELLFGLDFPDKVPAGSSPAGSELFRSALLDRVWGYGRCSVGAVNFKSAAYVARHNLAKVNGALADDHYMRIDYRTGELVRVATEFNEMSRRPGIGARWIEQYWRDVYKPGLVADFDAVIVNGREVRPPKYYDRYMKRVDPSLIANVRSEREQVGYENRGDNTPERLNARELVAKARLKFLKRDYS